MSVTVYFAKNAWFLQRLVDAPVEEPPEPRMKVVPVPVAPGTPEFEAMSQHLVSEAVEAGEDWRQSLGTVEKQPSTKLVTSTFAAEDADDMLFEINSLLETLEPSKGSTFGYLQIGGPGASLGNCKESISISRLDEGFVVNHQHPFDKTKISKLHDVPGDEWKGSERKILPAVAEAILELFPSPSRTGRKEVYGFKAAGEVVDYVRSACVKKD